MTHDFSIDGPTIHPNLLHKSASVPKFESKKIAKVQRSASV